jgi:hypothetical protein
LLGCSVASAKVAERMTIKKNRNEGKREHKAEGAARGTKVR